MSAPIAGRGTDVNASRLPLGIASNNPGNIRPGVDPWVGELKPPDPRGYCRFDSPENGIRALAKNLLAYQRKHNLRTVERIIARWAPGSENDTEAYIRHVCQLTGYRRDEAIDVGDPDVLHDLVVAIIRHENGPAPTPEGWYLEAVVSIGVMRAIA